MIWLNSIKLTHFRNYYSDSFFFKERIIGICGPNGSGKTNLLEALYYLCFGKSYFSRPDMQSSHFDLKGFRIDGQFSKNGQQSQVVCILRETNRKELLLDGEAYKKFSAHLGKFPCVFIAPDDVELITGTSEKRRIFIDGILCQFNYNYLKQLIDYKKILEERNSYLKIAGEKNHTDESLLDILDEQLISNGYPIHKARQDFVAMFIPMVLTEYQKIAGSLDQIDITYYSQLNDCSFNELLRQNRQRDLYLQRTSSGIHKDDLEATMNSLTFKNIASQGQRKSLLFALKLAEFAILKKEKGFAPLLLLDDVFEKLDAERMHNLLYKVCVEENGQVFITDTHKERLRDTLKTMDINYQIVDLNNR